MWKIKDLLSTIRISTKILIKISMSRGTNNKIVKIFLYIEYVSFYKIIVLLIKLKICIIWGIYWVVIKSRVTILKI